MQSLALKAYGDVQQRTASEKEIEYALFTQITQDLSSVASEDKPVPSVWADAISRNLQMWTVLATDLMGSGNTLPEETRKGLLVLSDFVRRTSMDVLSGGQGIADLVSINEIIMKGLAGEVDH
jgi:flagellar protein FlaF